MSVATIFRTCPTTGLKVDRSAENLIKANAVAAVVFLLIGGVFGLSIALTRWPAVHLLPADWFYLALTAHEKLQLFFGGVELNIDDVFDRLIVDRQQFVTGAQPHFGGHAARFNADYFAA